MIHLRRRQSKKLIMIQQKNYRYRNPVCEYKKYYLYLVRPILSNNLILYKTQILNFLTSSCYFISNSNKSELKY